MTVLKEKAKEAFDLINEKEYRCSLAESQVSEQLYEQVKKEYNIAENAFVQGAIWQHKIDIEKACEWLKQCITFNHPDYRHPVPYFDDEDIEEFKKIMSE